MNFCPTSSTAPQFSCQLWDWTKTPERVFKCRFECRIVPLKTHLPSHFRRSFDFKSDSRLPPSLVALNDFTTRLNVFITWLVSSAVSLTQAITACLYSPFCSTVPSWFIFVSSNSVLLIPCRLIMQFCRILVPFWGVWEKAVEFAYIPKANRRIQVQQLFLALKLTKLWFFRVTDYSRNPWKLG